MRKFTITLNSELGEKLNFTSDQFYDAFAWDCRPAYVGIIRLKPRTDTALQTFFEMGSKIYSTIVITAPDQKTIDMSKDYGYELRKDAAGLIYLTDEVSKTYSRQHTQELKGIGTR